MYARKTLSRTLINLFAWTVAAAITASDAYLNAGSGFFTFPGGSWWQVFGLHFLIWLPWTLVTPVIFYVARRIPIDRRNWWRAVLVHVTLSVIWVTSYAPVWVATVTWLHDLPWSNYGTFLAQMVNFRLYVDFFVTAVVIVVAYAAQYYIKYTEQARKAAELAAYVTKAELSVLKSQLQPHFLFNTLNSISGLIRTGDRDTALKVIAGLSDLLRYALETRESQLVELSREIDFVQTYLMIQKIRFQTKLDVDYDIDERCLTQPVPSMILQPLAENAVKHGAESGAGCNKIHLSASSISDGVSIEIVNSSGDFDKQTHGFGIGLSNTRKRMETLYGDRYELRMDDVDNKHTRVRLVIPAMPLDSNLLAASGLS